ncbi:MAG: glycoside hydrolase family 25 protein [Oscillospiraceae bacterium]|nr:glycoside hydrolase family 25 protein [Oscillospiraceae bacterium]
MAIFIYVHAGGAVNEYDFQYDDDGFSAVSKKSGEKKYFSKGNTKKEGIDISSWSGDIDWAKLKESGIEFVMIREGYGLADPNQVDKRFHKNIKEAQKNGIPCGAYHYSYATSVKEAIEEAEFCISNIKNYKLEYPIAFDIEDASVEKCCRREATDMCIAFCDTLRQAGYYATIYTNKNWITNFLFEGELFHAYDLWYAQWNEEITEPDYHCGIWQKKGDQKIDGVHGFADINECYYDYSQIMKDLHLNGN